MIRGLIGEKLGHSFSKLIHESLINKPYELMSLDQAAVIQLLQSKNIEAINVTIPYKELVIPYLDEVDQQVEKIQACNCIKNIDGKLVGYNTDYDGFMHTIKSHKLDLKGKKVLVIGKGGAAKAIEACLLDLQVDKLLFITRSKRVDTISYDELSLAYHVDWIINTSQLGMSGNTEELKIDLDKFNKLQGIIDIVYNPINTQLMIEGYKRNVVVIGGLDMLVAQAVRAVELFDNIELNPKIIDELVQSIKHDKENIVLIGMPFSGKTTIGKRLGALLKRDVIDVDELIEKEIGMPIATYFNLHSEEAFRKIESKIIKDMGAKNGLVIVTGGGAVKDIKNYDYLKQNGYIVHIHRPLSNIKIDNSRPLVKSIEELNTLWLKRESSYQLFQDCKIENNESIEECIERILDNYGNHI